ncbi:MAG: hypothetical protein IKS85_04415, partial [Lachnospiraceae bacterium]|nr:hypothetical protein [Lachnospiraceae bacterium]
MLIAALHSFFGLRFVKYALSFYLNKGIGYGVIVTTCLMFVLYGGYMLATIRSSEKIVGT